MKSFIKGNVRDICGDQTIYCQKITTGIIDRKDLENDLGENVSDLVKCALGLMLEESEHRGR